MLYKVIKFMETSKKILNMYWNKTTDFMKNNIEKKLLLYILKIKDNNFAL
jgi:hypothetical protein